MQTIQQFVRFVFFLFVSYVPLLLCAIEDPSIPFCSNDSDSYVRGVSVIDGSFTSVETDFVVIAPDPLILTRSYSSKDALEDTNLGGWRIFSQGLLALGQRSDGTLCAFAQEHSGAILTYREQEKGVFKVDTLQSSPYTGEISGRTDPQNNCLECKGNICELTLGDGTKRVYRETTEVLDKNFGGKLPSSLQVSKLRYFNLVSERLPSGNVLLFTYEQGRLALLEMKDAEKKKLHAWIRFDYDCKRDQCQVTVTTSDKRTLTYHFIPKGSHFVLQKVSGPHCIPISYEYESRNGIPILTKKILPEGRFLSIEYDESGRVKALKEPVTSPYDSEISRRFVYGEKWTECFNVNGLKTKYIYDSRGQVVNIEQYNKRGDLYRSDRKYWEGARLKSTAIVDEKGRVVSRQAFKYDERGNVEREWVYGNLTGQKEVFLNLDETGKILNKDQVESHSKAYKHSQDGLNLLTEVGDCKGGKVLFKYKTGTNLLTCKLIESSSGEILKRTFYSYTPDGVCDLVTEDDGSSEKITDLTEVTERHITAIQSKQEAPGIGLPEVIEEKVLEKKTKNQILVRKLIHSYSPQGYLCGTQVYDDQNSFAYSTEKTHTTLRQIETETDPEGRKIVYYYDDVGNQIRIEIPHQSKTIKKVFDARNRCVQVTESAGDLTSIQTDLFDGLGRKIASTDRFGQRTQFHYDEFGRVEKIVYPAVLDEQQQLITPSFSYSYDLFGNVLSITDPKGYVTSKSYNIRGNPTRILYPDGTSELFKYDTEGSLHRSLTRDSQVTVHEYDELGRVSYQETSKVGEGETHYFLKGHSYQYNGFRILEEEEQEGVSGFKRITQFQYDCKGNVLSSIQYDADKSKNDPSSRKMELSYDSLGREVIKKIWVGPGSREYFLECCEYDCLNQIKKRWKENGDGLVFDERHYEYNAFGDRMEEYTFRQGQRQILFTADYNPFGELISYSDALGNRSTIVVDDRGETLRKTLIDPLFNQTEVCFDALGRVVSTIKKDRRGTLLSSQKNLYDASGNKSIEMNEIVFQGDVLGTQATHLQYGPMGRLEAQIEAKGTPEEKRTEFIYDSYGRLSAKILSGLSVPFFFSYNKQGLVSKVEYNPKDKKSRIVNTYGYDDSGNMTSAKTVDGIVVDREYDVFGQITKERIQSSVEEFDQNYFSTYEYDRIGRVKKIRLPDRSSIVYAYNGLFEESVSRLAPNGKPQYLHSYDAYDYQGRVIQETTLAGPKTSSYDVSGRWNHQKTNFFSETIPDHGYDCFGNLKETRREGSFSFPSGSYEYDPLSQLTTEGSFYDSLYNSRFGRDGEYFINCLNQFTNSPQGEYFYDYLGNLSKKIINGKETVFTFDPLSHLISVASKDLTNLVSQFSYDALGRRIIKSQFHVRGDKKIFLSSSHALYFGFDELGSLQDQGKIQELRVPGCDRNGLSQRSIAIEIGGQVYAPLHDLTGNVIALIDAKTQRVVESYTYTPFSLDKIYDSSGKLTCYSSIGNPWSYKEKRLDGETGLFYFGARYYDPQNHRWISPDPLGVLGGPNQYAFVFNNPLKYFDRMGFAAEEISKSSLTDYFYGEVEGHCYCEVHRTCKRGGDIRDAIGGSSLGVSEFFMGILGSLIEAGFLATADDFGFDRTFKAEMHDAVGDSLSELHGMWNEGLVSAIGFDPQSEQALRYEERAYTGLIVLDILRGNIKDIRKGWSFFKNQREIGLTADLFSTIERIQKGIKFPHRNDGAIFKNREGLLPRKHSSYYREYVHPTPGIDGPGARRVIVGENSEMFYSPDHYKTFIKIE